VRVASAGRTAVSWKAGGNRPEGASGEILCWISSSRNIWSDTPRAFSSGIKMALVLAQEAVGQGG